MKLLAIVSLLISGTASYALAKPATHEVAAAYDANDIGKYIVGDTVLHVPKDYVFVTKNLEGKREVLSLNFLLSNLTSCHGL